MYVPYRWPVCLVGGEIIAEYFKALTVVQLAGLRQSLFLAVLTLGELPACAKALPAAQPSWLNTIIRTRIFLPKLWINFNILVVFMFPPYPPIRIAEIHHPLWICQNAHDGFIIRTNSPRLLNQVVWALPGKEGKWWYWAAGGLVGGMVADRLYGQHIHLRAAFG